MAENVGRQLTGKNNATAKVWSDRYHITWPAKEEMMALQTRSIKGLAYLQTDQDLFQNFMKQRTVHFVAVPVSNKPANRIPSGRRRFAFWKMSIAALWI
ncbi:hypothetical protein R1flu_000965 [Riccia fluitans]|uniref:Uncharacterized protein n=1 Tax=Riccia fluitans TaxID=41844 RepID=A0ABD1Y1Y5_9MARC